MTVIYNETGGYPLSFEHLVIVDVCSELNIDFTIKHVAHKIIQLTVESSVYSIDALTICCSYKKAHCLKGMKL